MHIELERRIKRQQARLLARSFEYRQRHHARGVWFRLRRVLTEASAAFVIPPEEALRLIAEGHRAEPVGEELEPQKLIVFARRERIEQITSARPVVPLRLSVDLLDAQGLALVAFDADV